jgi:ATP-binding cassette subfamily G (WHITE) protein 2 (PDR)
MPVWLRWFRYIDPVGYVFESLMINEFSGRKFACSQFIPQGPGYDNAGVLESSCTTVGAEPGSKFVNGDKYLAESFGYRAENLWRNLGIILAIMSLLCALYLISTEYISARRSKGEVLLFRRGEVPSQNFKADEESQEPPKMFVSKLDGDDAKGEASGTPSNTTSAAYLWDNLSYSIHSKDGEKKILDCVEGWIKPGSLTALMGASGAGKTTLLNVLANRTTTGIVGGEKLVDSKFRDVSFARKVGYAQQDDLVLATSTVREALTVSAILRQPKSYSDAEKLDWVDHLIHTLDMSMFAEAIVGVPGEGINIEQRKRLTIGIELAARPELLLFLGMSYRVLNLQNFG